MDNQVRRRPVLYILRGIPLLVTFAVFQEGAAEFVIREEELFGGVLVQSTKYAVMRNQCFELAAKWLTLNPIYLH